MTLTLEELARLRVPLDKLPGLDAVGLTAYAMDLQWIVIGDGGCEGLDILAWTLDEQVPVPREVMAISLADSATADRVARWCAGRVGLEVGCTAPGWRSYSARADPPLAIWLLGEPGDARVFANQPRRDPPLTGWAYSRAVENVVPALADLDPTDARLLPDGARWIDRLALALVATHLGGTP
jgi:hypothetical protein